MEVQLPRMRISCGIPEILLSKKRPDKVVEHRAGPDQSTCKEVNMAAAVDATNPSCQQCGVALKSGWNMAFCSTRCRNIASADHSSEALMRRFWKKVDKAPGFGPQGECWRWTARVDGHGYGEIKVAGRYKKAHRLALFGPDDLQNPLLACHRCDNPRCVRPSHLFPGEPIDNVQDMHAKGRAYNGPWKGHAAGKHPGRKLTDEQVREIRASGISRRKGAAKYGVSTFTIDGVKRRTLYKDIP